MPKKHGGGFFGNFFDFNGDGFTDIGEEWIAFKIFEECMKDDTDDSEDELFDDFYEWRLYCEDGLEYGVSPYDYEFEFEYEEALEAAKRAYAEAHKYDWRKTCDGNDYDIDPENFETQSEYDAAVEEREWNWKDYLSDEIQEKITEYALVLDDFFSEDDLLLQIEQFDMAILMSAMQPSRPKPPSHNTLLENALVSEKRIVFYPLF